MTTTTTAEDAIGIGDKEMVQEREARDFQQYVSYLKRGQENVFKIFISMKSKACLCALNYRTRYTRLLNLSL